MCAAKATALTTQAVSRHASRPWLDAAARESAAETRPETRYATATISTTQIHRRRPVSFNVASSRDVLPVRHQLHCCLKVHEEFGQRCANKREVVIAVANSMILEHKLAGERRIRVERNRSSAIQILFGQPLNLDASLDGQRVSKHVSRIPARLDLLQARVVLLVVQRVPGHA
jgi:hypothetical protein